MKVYEVSCDCDVVDLYATLSNEVSAVSKVEYAPVYETLETQTIILYLFQTLGLLI